MMNIVCAKRDREYVKYNHGLLMECYIDGHK